MVGTKAPLLVAMALAAVSILCGCKPRPGHLEFGQPCTQKSQCESGLCLFGGPEDDEGVCGQPCKDGNDCPEGWSCTGLTQNSELVCLEGPATPFGM